MLQEVITYMIVGAAVTFTIMKLVNRFSKKKAKKTDYKKATISTEHNCTECAAECMLRDAAKPVIESSSQTVCSSKKIKLK